MVLKHIPKHTCLFIINRSVFNPQGFSCCDLHVIDISTIPYGLKDRVGKPKHQQVLHGLLGQVMIDAIDLVLSEVLTDVSVKFQSALQVPPERFFDDYTGPSTPFFVLALLCPNSG